MRLTERKDTQKLFEIIETSSKRRNMISDILKKDISDKLKE